MYKLSTNHPLSLRDFLCLLVVFTHAPPLRLDQSNLNSFHRIPSITKFDWPLTAKNKSSNNHSLFPWIILCEGNNYRMITERRFVAGRNPKGDVGWVETNISLSSDPYPQVKIGDAPRNFLPKFKEMPILSERI